MNNVFDAANKPNTKRNKLGLILYSPNIPPLNSRVKGLNFFSTLGLIASAKNIKKKYMIIVNTLYSVGYMKQASNFAPN